MKNRRALLAAQQAQIDKLVGLRSQIIEDLRDNLSNVGQRVTVDRKTGAVTFESSVLFDTGKNEIKDAGKGGAQLLHSGVYSHAAQRRISGLCG